MVKIIVELNAEEKNALVALIGLTSIQDKCDIGLGDDQIEIINQLHTELTA